MHEDDDELPSLEEMSDLGTGMHVITITYHNDASELPEIDLGDCNPWVATTILRAALDSVEIMIPPMSVTYKGEAVVSHSIIFDDEDDE